MSVLFCSEVPEFFEVTFSLIHNHYPVVFFPAGLCFIFKKYHIIDSILSGPIVSDLGLLRLAVVSCLHVGCLVFFFTLIRTFNLYLLGDVLFLL